MTLAIVRVRGTINIKNDIRDTLAMLNLGRVNHCVLIDESPQYMGMLGKVKDYVTWGPIDAKTASLLVKERGLLEGRRPVDEKKLKDLGKFASFEDLGSAIADGKVKWSKLDGTVPVFRLHPPRKGYEGVKRAFTVGGALGNRGEAINSLIQRMI
jgi:large subunit ribosomal protein L30